MNCETFRTEIDRRADLGEILSREQLSSDLRSHLDECGECADYLESIGRVEHALRNPEINEMPPDLYAGLLNLEKGRFTKNTSTEMRSAFIHILKIIIPATCVWALAQLLPQPASLLIEISMVIFATALAFEKIGRRLIADGI